MKIDPTKKYRTRGGQEVTLLHRVPDGWPTIYPWRGIVCNSPSSWTDGGEEDIDDEVGSPHDLVEVREPREWWIEPADTCDGFYVRASPVNGAIHVREVIEEGGES